jgi:methionine biosynthesis protein MetW
MAEGARIDHSVILALIPAGTKVLDLGCGDGSLLVKLVRQKGVTGRGIEISEEGVRACIAKGLTVLQGDIDQGLRDYPDGSFDYVVLNQTLQAVKKPDVVLSEMLRVGKKGIVGFPNFAYWKMRSYLFTFGRMPRHAEHPLLLDPRLHRILREARGDDREDRLPVDRPGRAGAPGGPAEPVRGERGLSSVGKKGVRRPGGVPPVWRYAGFLEGRGGGDAGKMGIDFSASIL